jgi:hypothetical protein
MRVEITRCIWISHSAYGNRTLRVEITLVRVEIHSRECRNYICTCQNHTAC